MEFFLFSVKSKGFALPVKDIKAIVDKPYIFKIPFSEQSNIGYVILYREEIYMVTFSLDIEAELSDFSIFVLTHNHLAVPVNGIEKRIRIEDVEKTDKKVINYYQKDFVIFSEEDILRKVAG